MLSGGAGEIAAQVALDHWLTWQVRHLAIDRAGVASIAAAYRRGESARDQVRPRTWIEEETREVGSTVRSRLLCMRYLAPALFRELWADGALGLSRADRLLMEGAADAAVQAYCDEIADSAGPRPDAWIGLALALHQLPSTAAEEAIGDDIALILEVHSKLGGLSNPLDLARWFA